MTPTLLAAIALSLASPPAPSFFTPSPPATSPAKAPTYADVLARVVAGEILIVAVGESKFPYVDLRIDRIPGEPPGAYRCYLDRGVPTMRRLDPPAPLPSFVAPSFAYPRCTGPNCPRW